MPSLFGSGMRQIGKETTGSAEVPANATGMIVTIDRASLGGVYRNRNSENSIERIIADILIERSMDGGRTWEGAGGCGFEGGDFYVNKWRTDPDSPFTLVPTSVLKFRWPTRMVNKGLMVRGVYETFARCRTKVDIEWRYDPMPEMETHHSVSITDYGGGEVSGSTTVTVAATTATGSNTIGVCVCGNSNNNGQATSSITRNAEGWGILLDHSIDVYDDHCAAYKLGPSSGSATTAVVFAGNTYGAAGVYMMDGAAQEAPDYAHDNTTSSPISDSVTSATDGMVVAIGKCYGSGNIEPTESGQTEDEEFTQSGGDTVYQSFSRRAGQASSTTMGYSWSGGEYCDIYLVAVDPAAVAAGASQSLANTHRLASLVGGGLTK